MKEWIRDILIAIGVGILIMQFIKPTIVKEHSMEPTLYENNYIFLSKQQYRFSEIENGQIIVFQSDMEGVDGNDKLLIKRVIAIPGDTIAITGGAVYLNGDRIQEAYIKGTYTDGDVDETLIPEGKIFVMGDNREQSMDSRSERIGLVSEDKVVGMAVFRIFPFSMFGRLK